MKTAGLVLDFYDDRGGEILKEAFPTPDALPESVKAAHILSPAERGVLRDEAFALILHSDDGELRKFACVDEGNTLLSTLYFLQNAAKLPAEAIKTAAVNLIEFNKEFELPIPLELILAAETGMPTVEKTADSSDAAEKRWSTGEKVAANALARKRDSKQQPFVGDEADWAQRTNLISVRGGADSGRVIPTANQMKTASRVVDVSAAEPRPFLKSKAASKTALAGRYSLDSYLDVQRAVAYFDENWSSFTPAQRHEFAVKTAARADELGIKVSEVLDRYGSTEYAPDIEAHLANRRAVDPAHREIWDDLQEKVAMVEPEQFAQLLTEADELFNLDVHWGGAVADPYYATFGGRGHEKVAWAHETSDGSKIDEAALRAIPRSEIEKNFASDFAEAFAANPTVIFDSMPADTKQVLARMAQEG